MILADTAVNWNSVFDGLMALGTVGLFFIALRKNRVQVDQPLQVEFAKKFADKHEFERHVEENKREHEQIRDEFKTERKDNQVHISQRQKTLFDEIKNIRELLEDKMESRHNQNTDRLNGLEQSVAGLTVAVDMGSKQTSDLGARIDRLASKL